MKNLVKKVAENKNGITLMALVVTIIILLILAGISIGMLSGNNSIINQAENAKTQTDIAQEKEILEQATVVAMGKSKYGNVEKDYLDAELDKTPGSENYSSTEVNRGILVTFKSKRSYVVEANGNIGEYIVYNRTGINVGDYVDYTPSTKESIYPKEELSSVYTGSDKNSSDLVQDSLKWQVLNIHQDGSIDLIGTPTSQYLYLYGARGYNNGVYILNDICERLYSNQVHKIKARSINLEDFENNLTDTGKNARNNNYNMQKTYTDYYWYPNLYENENGSGVNITEGGELKTNGITNSEKSTLDISTNVQSKKATESVLSLTQTYYNIEISEENFGNASEVVGNSAYWIATRSIYCGTDATFMILCLARDEKDSISSVIAQTYGFRRSFLYKSSNISYYDYRKIRPVITIEPDIEIIRCNGINNLSNMHTIKW